MPRSADSSSPSRVRRRRRRDRRRRSSSASSSRSPRRSPSRRSSRRPFPGLLSYWEFRLLILCRSALSVRSPLRMDLVAMVPRCCPPLSRSRLVRRSWLPFLVRLRRLRPSIRPPRLVFLRRRRPGAACRPALTSVTRATGPASQRLPLALAMVGLPRLPRGRCFRSASWRGRSGLCRLQ